MVDAHTSRKSDSGSAATAQWTRGTAGCAAGCQTRDLRSSRATLTLCVAPPTTKTPVRVAAPPAKLKGAAMRPGSSGPASHTSRNGSYISVVLRRRNGARQHEDCRLCGVVSCVWRWVGEHDSSTSQYMRQAFLQA